MKTKLLLFTFTSHPHLLKGIIIPLFTFTFILHLPASIPLRWNVDATRVSPVTFDAYHGETLALEPTFYDGKTPLEGSFTGVLYWQTNGMETVYWSTNLVTVTRDASTSNLTATATFLGAFDPGAPAVRGFVALTATSPTAPIYRAAFTLRFRPSPGYDPAVVQLPTRTLDCATTAFLNPSAAPFATDAKIAAEKAAAIATAAAYTDAATNATTVSLSSQLSQAATAAMNYTDAAKSSAIATASADATAKANAAQSAAVSTASDDATAKANAAQSAATAAAKTYADATFLKTTGGTIDGDVFFRYGIQKFHSEITFGYDDDYCRIGYIDRGEFYFSDGQLGNVSFLLADGSPVATSNMVEGVVAPATNATLAAAKAYTDAKTPVPLAGRRFDFATMRGMYEAVSNVVYALGGSITNYPSFN